MFDEPPPQDHDFDEQVEVETTDDADKPTSPVRTDDGPSSPVKAADIPSTLVKATGDKEDDVIITGVGTPPLAILLCYQSIVPRRNSLLWAKASGAQICPATPTSMPKNFILVS